MVINGATKRGQTLLANAKVNLGDNLRSVYGRWSDRKETAMRDCRKEFAEDKGYDFRIISANRYRFSVAWNFTNQETGEVMTKIKTGVSTYVIDGTRVSTEV